MTKNRIFVEKTAPYRIEAESLRKELNSNLGLDIKEAPTRLRLRPIRIHPRTD